VARYEQTDDSITNYLLYRRHLFAYETACQKAGHWSVAVDMPCGLGIGVPLLSRPGAKVLAIDLASKALRTLPARSFACKPTRLDSACGQEHRPSGVVSAHRARTL